MKSSSARKSFPLFMDRTFLWSRQPSTSSWYLRRRTRKNESSLTLKSHCHLKKMTFWKNGASKMWVDRIFFQKNLQFFHFFRSKGSREDKTWERSGWSITIARLSYWVDARKRPWSWRDNFHATCHGYCLEKDGGRSTKTRTSQSWKKTRQNDANYFKSTKLSAGKSDRRRNFRVSRQQRYFGRTMDGWSRQFRAPSSSQICRKSNWTDFDGYRRRDWACTNSWDENTRAFDHLLGSGQSFL